MPLMYTDIKTILLLVFLFILTYYLAVCAEKRSQRGKTYVIIIIVLLTLVCGLRSTTVGRDTAAYYRDIQLVEFGSVNALNYYEVGFRLFVKFVLLITNSVQSVILVIALLSIGLIVARLWEMHDAVPFSKAILFFFCISYCTLFSGIRQWIAVAIVFYASRYIVKEKYFAYIFSVIIAASFHLMAIISLGTLVMYLLFTKNIRRKMIKSLLLVLSLSAFIALCVSMNYITANTRYSISFFKQEPDIGFMIISRFVLLILFYLNYRSSLCSARKKSFCLQTNTLLSISMHLQNYLLYVATCVLGGFFGSSIGRLSWFFIPYEWTLFSCGISSRKHWSYWIIKVLVFVIAFYSFYCFAFMGIEYLTPYKFFWQ